MALPKEICDVQRTHAKRTPGEALTLRGFFLGSLSLLLVVEPLVDVGANYTRHNSQQEICDIFQRTHLPLLPE
jgi:hypothetical protein